MLGPDSAVNICFESMNYQFYPQPVSGLISRLC